MAANDNFSRLHPSELPATDPAATILMEGIQLAQTDQLEEALTRFEQATLLVPQSFHAWYLRGTIELTLDQLDAAELSFLEALKRESRNTEVRYLLAHTHFLQDYVEEAAGELQDILAETPDFLDAYYDCGVALQIMGRYEDAIATFLRRLEFSPDFDTSLMCAMTCELVHDYEHALEHYHAALLLDPQNVMVVENHGATCLELGRYDDALADFQHALELDPGSPDALYGRGRTYFCMEKTDQALEDLSVVVRLDPENTLAWSMLGQVKLYLEQNADALECFDKAMSIDPDILIYDFRAQAKIALGDLPGALEELREGVEQEPENEELVEFYGTTLMEALQYEEAVEVFSRLIELLPTETTPYLRRGEAWYQLGNSAAALEDFHQSLEIARKYQPDYVEKCQKIVRNLSVSDTA